jgi:hypothetical protein
MPWRDLLVLGLLASLLLPQPAVAGVTIDGIDYPDPLEKSNGSMVENVDDWERNRRPELLELFRREFYGRPPPTPSALTCSVSASEFPTVTRKLVRIGVTGPYGTASFTLRLFIPPGLSAPPPIFLPIDHRGAVTDNPTQDAEFFPMPSLTRRGYAAAAFDVAEVAPDDPATYRSRLIVLFHPAGTTLPDDAGRAISAWSWPPAASPTTWSPTRPSTERGSPSSGIRAPGRPHCLPGPRTPASSWSSPTTRVRPGPSSRGASTTASGSAR